IERLLWVLVPIGVCGLPCSYYGARSATRFRQCHPASPGGPSKGGARGAGGTRSSDPGRVSDGVGLASGCTPLPVYPIG
ncbi:MAG TPA: hypothetical protein VLY63_32440, partial [Anaerolineae bacterium]|nr:hypothetical protein [Anaerolineae bacterium]